MSEVPQLEHVNKKTGTPKWSISFYIVLKNKLFRLSEGYPHDWCCRTVKKLFCNENRWNLVVTLKRMMNMFTGDLYSMYVVLQGIGSLSCIRAFKGIHYIRNSLWGIATLDVWSSSTRTFQQKKRVLRNDQFLFILYYKHELFRLTEGYPPRLVL